MILTHHDYLHLKDGKNKNNPIQEINQQKKIQEISKIVMKNEMFGVYYVEWTNKRENRRELDKRGSEEDDGGAAYLYTFYKGRG